MAHLCRVIGKTADSMRLHQGVIIVLLSGLAQAARINASDDQQLSQIGPDTPHMQRTSRALRPGDPDYPLLNPAVAQVVQFTAIMPPTLSGEFHLWYRVEIGKDSYPEDANVPLHSPAGCRWTQDRQFHVDLVLELEKSSGDRYTGSFSPDLFQPGNCRWHFDRITSSIANAPLVFFNHSLHKTPHPLPGLDLSTDLVNLWCTRKQEGQVWRTAPDQLVNCVPLSMIDFWTARPVPKGLPESVPAEERQLGSHIVNQYLKSLTIALHDFDAYASAF